MATNFIKKGDKGNIYWENIKPEFNAKVIATPECPGDSWCFEKQDGTLFYSYSFAKMERI